MANGPRTRSTTLSDTLSDRLSELPWSIIQDILGRVPIRDAVKTCVLSSQWRYTWTTLSRLLFTSTGVNDEWETLDNSAKKFIDNVLLHHRGPVHRVKMSYSCTSAITSFEKWVLCFSGKDIREVIIYLQSEDCCGSLKSSLYECVKLTKLRLGSFKISPPPSSFRGFLDLKTIALVSVILSSAGFESFVGHCPVLENLVLINCSIKELKVHSQSLKDLHLRGFEHEQLSLHAPLLDEIYVELSAVHDPDSKSTVCNYTDLLGSSTNLLELSGDRLFLRYLSFGLDFYHPTVVFHQLKVMDLQGVSFTKLSEISVLARLITDAPNLQKLKIEAMLWDADGAPDVSFSDHFGFNPDFTLEKLKEVRLPYVCNYPTGMQLIKFLLESSPVLQTMELLLASLSHLDKVSAEVLGFNQASPNAKITFI